jgi:hypothetical protein
LRRRICGFTRFARGAACSPFSAARFTCGAAGDGIDCPCRVDSAVHAARNISSEAAGNAADLTINITDQTAACAAANQLR